MHFLWSVEHFEEFWEVSVVVVKNYTYFKTQKYLRFLKMHYITSFSFNNTTSKMRSNLL